MSLAVIQLLAACEKVPRYFIFVYLILQSFCDIFTMSLGMMFSKKSSVKKLYQLKAMGVILNTCCNGLALFRATAVPKENNCCHV